MHTKNEKILFLQNYFIERDGREILEKLESVDLIASGLLDSLDVIDLAVRIEERFGIKIDLSSEEVFSAMRSFKLILGLID